MPSLITALCQLFVCTPEDLGRKLENAMNVYRAEKFLLSKKLFIDYGDRQREIRFNSLSSLNAQNAKAYNGYLGVTVQQHFYCRHRKVLKFANLPLVVDYSNKNRAYYPIELLTLVENDESGYESSGFDSQ